MTAVVISILTLVVAAATAAIMVPAINRIAITRKLLDYPDGDRHHHARPVPRLGGVAVFGGLLVAVSLSALISPSFAEVTPWALPLNRALVVASAILFLVGLFDDLHGVSPGLKLIAQSAAAAVVIAYGFIIERVAIVPGYEFSLGVFSVPVTVIWLVGVSNAFNLVDGLDGLAGGVGVIALAAICASSVALGGIHVPVQSMALAGALLGFLRHNWPLARIFLGDSGSLAVGFLLAFLAVRGSTTQQGVVYGLIPIFALSYLLLDTGIAIMRRWLRGAPLSRADGRHIHHQLLQLGLTPRRALWTIYTQAAFIALLGLCVTFVPPQMTLAITAIGVALLLVTFLYGVRWLEYHEFLEAGASFASGVRKARTAIQDRILARDVARMLRTAGSVEEIHDVVHSHTAMFRFVHMEVLHENAPAAANVWAPAHIGSPTWLLEYPIPVGGGSENHPGARKPVLAIWSPVAATNGRSGAGSAERVAQILAPAIAAALDSVRESSLDTAMDGRGRVRGTHFHSRRSQPSEHRRMSSEAAPPM